MLVHGQWAATPHKPQVLQPLPVSRLPSRKMSQTRTRAISIDRVAARAHHHTNSHVGLYAMLDITTETHLPQHPNLDIVPVSLQRRNRYPHDIVVALKKDQDIAAGCRYGGQMRAVSGSLESWALTYHIIIGEEDLLDRPIGA